MKEAEIKIQSGPLPEMMSPGKVSGSFADILRKMNPGEWVEIPIKQGERTNNVRARLTGSGSKTLGKGMISVRLRKDQSGFIVIRLPNDEEAADKK